MVANRASGSAGLAHHARPAQGAATFFITRAQVEDVAFRLDHAHPHLSARDLRLRRFSLMFISLIALACLCLFSGGALKLGASLVLVLLFGGALALRIVALICGLIRAHPSALALGDDELPTYTILVPLFREATIILQLVEALDRLDYPRSKLQILLLLEEEDHDTRSLLERINLESHYSLVILPKGLPQTKPRALNVGLSLARGDLTCIYDAEDDPHPEQLRQVAALFARLDQRFACLQCPLNIYNPKASAIASLFTLEYAALFHLLDPGLTHMRLPVPLGGTSNHFHTKILRELHGWDAWNVTEDADMGLRLARHGYLVATLSTPTYEEAPTGLRAWLMQRKRWMKGWMQTLCVLLRDPVTLLRDLGLFRSIAVLLLLAGGVIGPLSWPLFAGVLAIDLVTGGLFDFSSLTTSLTSILWSGTAVLGVVMAFAPLILGAQRCKITHLLIWLPLVPLLYVLLFVAAGLALYDLFKRPHYWDKTAHGHGLQKRPKNPPFG
jgi:cellulose synthase/poly-beta-1,6-N-acetylglucosamine synthase-like glycosyltransferase